MDPVLRFLAATRRHMPARGGAQRNPWKWFYPNLPSPQRGDTEFSGRAVYTFLCRRFAAKKNFYRTYPGVRPAPCRVTVHPSKDAPFATWSWTPPLAGMCRRFAAKDAQRNLDANRWKIFGFIEAPCKSTRKGDGAEPGELESFQNCEI
jgi:hypothetical protein